jgi:hypothetical protein
MFGYVDDVLTIREIVRFALQAGFVWMIETSVPKLGFYAVE